MSNIFSNLSPKSLRRAADIQEKILDLKGELSSILGATEATETPSPRRKMSAAGRRRIAAAQRARWARIKAGRSGSSEAPEAPARRRKMSPSARARIATAQRARWARIHAKAGKPEKATKRRISAAGRKRIAAARTGEVGCGACSKSCPKSVINWQRGVRREPVDSWRRVGERAAHLWPPLFLPRGRPLT